MLTGTAFMNTKQRDLLSNINSNFWLDRIWI